MGSTKVLKDLMLGLIYPAVLGTVMYSSFQIFADWLATRLGIPASGASLAEDPALALKLCLLLIAVSFYCFDYMYIMFTNVFYWGFFVCDLIFLVTLYVTVAAIGMGKAYQPQTSVILVCYAIFMGLYLIWDVFELRQCIKAKKENSGEEIRFYRQVIAWEVVSLGALGALGAPLWLGELDGSLFSVRLATVLTAVITGFFGWFSWRKQKFFKETGVARGASK